MTTRQEYIAMKRKLYASMDEIRKAKVQLVDSFLRSRYPDLRFRIFAKDSDYSNLNITVELADVDTAETNFVNESIKTYLNELEEESKKGDTCTTIINPTQ